MTLRPCAGIHSEFEKMGYRFMSETWTIETKFVDKIPIYFNHMARISAREGITEGMKWLTNDCCFLKLVSTAFHLTLNGYVGGL